jgi:hypothetical protein
LQELYNPDYQPNINMSSDDSFQLYDLRVEVICPEGKRILCGAKEGDYFTLKGEMMHLPPGQGISIYSLGTLFSSTRFHALQIYFILWLIYF